LAALHAADPRRRRLPGHEESLERAADLPSAPASSRSPHLSLRPRLSPAGDDREVFPRPRSPHLLGDPPPAAGHPSGRHHGPADQRRPTAQDPTGHDARGSAQGDLRHPEHPPPSHRPRQDLAANAAGAPRSVVTKNSTASVFSESYAPECGSWVNGEPAVSSVSGRGI